MFVQNVGFLDILGNVFRNQGEVLYAISMILATVISGQFIDFSLKNDYKFWYAIGENCMILVDDVINYNPKFEYDYGVSDSQEE